MRGIVFSNEQRLESEEIECEEAEVTKSVVSSASRFSFHANDAMVKENQSSVGNTESEVVLKSTGVNEITCKELTDSEAEKDNSAKHGGASLNSAAKQPKSAKLNTRLKKSDLHISSHGTSI